MNFVKTFSPAMPIVFLAAQALGQAAPQTQPTTKPAQEAERDPLLYPQVKLETTMGDIVLELNAATVPITVQNFVRYLKEGFYEDTIFHHVAPDMMIQGGGWTSDMRQKKDGLHEPITCEWPNELSNKRGTIAAARRIGLPGSATSQFFINLVDNPNLDHIAHDGAGFVVFGKVIDGMDVVEAISRVELITHPDYKRHKPVTPAEPVIVRSAKLITPYSEERVAAQVGVLERKRAREAEESRVRQLDLYGKKLAELRKKYGDRLEQSPSGLRYIMISEGGGRQPAFGDVVEVHYSAELLDGTAFDSTYSRGRTMSVPIGQLFPGLAEGIQMLREGGEIRLIVPPELAYGEKGRPPAIPPYAYLIYDVELISIEQ